MMQVLALFAIMVFAASDVYASGAHVRKVEGQPLSEVCPELYEQTRAMSEAVHILSGKNNYSTLMIAAEYYQALSGMYHKHCAPIYGEIMGFKKVDLSDDEGTESN